MSGTEDHETRALICSSRGEMTENSVPQIEMIEKLLRRGFELVTLEHVERYLGVEKGGFVALLEASEGKLRVFGQPGYRIEGGIGMLVERPAGKAFVWKQFTVPATRELLDAYQRFRSELAVLLETPAR